MSWGHLTAAGLEVLVQNKDKNRIKELLFGQHES